MLEVKSVSFAYGDVQVLHDVSLRLTEREAVCLIGANGAGKSTLANLLAGILKPSNGYVLFDGERIDRLPAHRTVQRGVSLVPEGRRLFVQQSVRQNLELGAYHRPGNGDLSADLQAVFSLFPVLADRQHQLAGTLSGGEQQMLAVGRAMMAQPRLLILDEPSMGLSPILVAMLGRTLAQLKERGLSILLIEQNAELALTITDRGYVIETGRIVLEASSGSLRDDPSVKRIYLGDPQVNGVGTEPRRKVMYSVPAWLSASLRKPVDGDEGA